MSKPARRFSLILLVLGVCLLTRPGLRGQEAGTLASTSWTSVKETARC